MNVMNTVTIPLVVILVTVLDLAIDFTVMETHVKVTLYNGSKSVAFSGNNAIAFCFQISMNVPRVLTTVLSCVQMLMEATRALVLLGII